MKRKIERIVALDTEWGLFRCGDIVKITIHSYDGTEESHYGRLIRLGEDYLRLDVSKEFSQSTMDFKYENIQKIED